jgi:hypothetical protein
MLEAPKDGKSFARRNKRYEGRGNLSFWWKLKIFGYDCQIFTWLREKIKWGNESKSWLVEVKNLEEEKKYLWWT